MRKLSLFSILSFSTILFFQQNISAQRDWSKIEIKAEKVVDNIYMLTGSGGNIGVFIGEDGVFMIDNQYAPLSEKIEKAIKELSDQPINILVNTHWHGDHTGGNENFGKKGLTIIAHENVRKRMSTEQQRPFRKATPASPKIALPTITFKEDINFHINGEDVMVFHVHHAHTDGDAILYFPKSNVVHMGDCFFKGRYPYIDLGSGGSVDGALKAISQVLFLADEDTKIIPGHGSLATKKDLLESQNVIMTIRDRIKKGIASKMTLEEIKASNLSKEYDEEWGSGFINPEKFVEIIYSDLTKDVEEEK